MSPLQNLKTYAGHGFSLVCIEMREEEMKGLSKLGERERDREKELRLEGKNTEKQEGH